MASKTVGALFANHSWNFLEYIAAASRRMPFAAAGPLLVPGNGRIATSPHADFERRHKKPRPV